MVRRSPKDVHMPDVFDLDALAAEEEGEPFRFTFGGQEFAATAFDPRALTAFAAGDTVTAFRRMLGTEQAARFEAIDEPLTMGRLKALVTAWSEHFGLAEGEAKASSRSSKGTGRPSKRTSNGPTASVSAA
jgi:hypothetical protein